MSLTRKVAFNSSVQMIGRLVGTLISFVTVKLLTTHLGPAGYGEYAAILNYIAFFGTLADFGFYWILVRELAAHPNDTAKTNHTMGNVVALRSVFALMVLACAVVAVYLVPTGLIPILTPTVKLGVLVVALAIFWQSLNMTYVAIFQTHYRMDRPVVAELIGRVVSLVVLVPFLLWHLNVAWLVSALVWGAIVNFLVNVYFARSYSTFSLQFDFPYWNKLFRQSAVLGVVSVLALVYFKIDSVILSILKTSTEVGIYAAPYKIIEILNFFPAAFMGIVFVALTDRWREDKQRAEALVHRAVEAMVFLSFPVLCGGIVLAPTLMRFITDAQYASVSTFTGTIFGHSIAFSGIIILQMLLIAVTIDFFGNIFGKAVIAFGSQHLLLWPNVIAVIFNIVANIILIPRWSYAGAALTTIITEAIVLVLQIYLLSKFIRLRVPWDTLWRTLLAVFGMVLALIPLREANALIGLVVGSLVYLGLAWLTGAISKETMQLILRRSE